MKRFLAYTLIAFVMLSVGAGFSMHTAQAQTSSGSGVASVIGQATGITTAANVASLLAPSAAKAAGAALGLPLNFDLWLMVGTVLSYIMNFMLMLAGWFLGITGTLLNLSIVLTLHIRDFVNATPAIFIIWETIRDISGMFIIFFLLYASIKMILGLNTGFGNLIKNIVVAGVLINFSFFVSGLAIDASNVVSLALYHAMTPSTTAEQAIANGQGFIAITQAVFNGGGISNVFMQSLHINNLYDPKNLSAGQQAGAIISDPFKVIMIGFIGIVIMVTAGLSFLAASGAFVVRLFILLFLLAFSPIWFAAAIVPEIKKYADDWWHQFKSMLIFMPVYLLLMYAGLSILNSSQIFNLGATAQLFQGNLGTVGAFTPINFIMIAMNAALVIFMLNLPLVAAIALGGKATSWINGDKIGAAGIWKRISSQAGSRTLGRAAYSLNESAGFKKFASATPLFGGLASSGLKSVSKAGFGMKKGGYEDRLKGKKKGYEDMHKNIGDVDRANYALDKKGEDEFKKAKELAKEYQKDYRKNLPWTSSIPLVRKSIIGRMLDNRANIQSQSKLSEDADKKAKKDAKKDADAQLGKVRKIIANLNDEAGSSDAELNSLIENVSKSSKVNEARKTLGLEGLTGNAEQRIKEINAMKANKKEAIKKWEDVAEKLRQTVKEGEEVENEERNDKILSKLEDLDKKGGSEGGGDKKSEDKK